MYCVNDFICTKPNSVKTLRFRRLYIYLVNKQEMSRLYAALFPSHFLIEKEKKLVFI